MSEGIVIALLTLFGVVFTGVLTYLGARYSKKAASSSASVDKAVNQVRDGEPRLIDIVRDIRAHQELHELKFDVKLDKLHEEMRAADSNFLTVSEIVRLVNEVRDQHERGE